MADLTTSIKLQILDAFTGPMRQFGIELSGADTKLEKLGRRFEHHAKLAGDLNQAAEGMGRFGDAVVSSLRKPIEDFASFDQALARVSAKTGEARGSMGFEQLKKQAEDLGASTKYSAEQVAGAQAEFAASGRNTQEVLQALPSTLSLATAGSIDLALATQYTNETLNQFRLGAEKTAFVQDVLARADEVSAASITDLGESFSYVGSTLASLNVPIQESAAYLAILADGGLKASRGGTSFQMMLGRLKSPSKEASKALHELGLSQKGVLDLQKQIATGKLEQAFTTLAEKSAKLAPEKRARLLTDIFGAEGERAANVLLPKVLDTGAKGLKSYITQFSKVDGAVNRTAKIMENSLAGSLERAGGALSGLSTQIGETLAPTVKSLSLGVEGFADTASKLAKKYPDATRASLELVGGLGALSLAMKGILLTQSAYHGGLAALSKTYAVMSGSLLGSAGLIAAAGLAGYAIGTWAEQTFHIADKLNAMIGSKPPPGSRDKSGVEAGGAEVYGDGSVIDLKNNRIEVGPDQSKWPKEIRDAVASGAKGGMPGVADFIRRRRGERAQASKNSPLSNDALDAGATLPSIPLPSPVPLSLQPKQEASSSSLMFTASTKAQTEALLRGQQDSTNVLERAVVEQTKATKQLLEETRKANRGREPGAGSPYGTGAF